MVLDLGTKELSLSRCDSSFLTQDETPFQGFPILVGNSGLPGFSKDWPGRDREMGALGMFHSVRLSGFQPPSFYTVGAHTYLYVGWWEMLNP